VDGKDVKIYLHEVVLSYSRKKYYTYSLSITTSDVIRAITEAIEFFGGVAVELVIDNPRQMVITHDRDGIVRYDEETKKTFFFLTNNFVLAASTIAQIFKSRWQIELFFKWIKQNLKIKSFLGTSKNAVMTQIWVPLIESIRGIIGTLYISSIRRNMLMDF
jgi:hypothetical protein